MAQIDISVERYQTYRQEAASRYGVDVVNGAILLDLLLDGSSGSSAPTDPSTGANQALAIASLQALDLDNATEQQQVAIKNAIDAMTLALQNDDNATATKQDAIIAKNEAIRLLNAEISGKITTNISQLTSLNSKLGYSATSKLSDAIADLETLSTEIKARLGDAAISTALPDVRSLLKSLDDKQGAEITWATPVDGTVTTTNVEILPAVATRRHFLICNLDLAEYILLNTGKAASATSAIAIVQPGQTVILESDGKAQINAIASAGTINYTYKIGV